MGTLPVQVVPHDGLSASYTPADSAGDRAACGGGIALHVKNSDASAHTVTLAVPEKVDSLAVQSREVAVPASGEVFIPLPDLYEDPSDGLAAITYDAAASLTVAVIRVAS